MPATTKSTKAAKRGRRAVKRAVATKRTGAGHGGVMHPRHTAGAVAMQEWPGYVVVNEHGNTMFRVVDSTKGRAIARFLMVAATEIKTPKARKDWRGLEAKGFRVARVAVVEDA